MILDRYLLQATKVLCIEYNNIPSEKEHIII